MAFIGKPLAQPLDIGSQKTVSSPNYFADHGYRERSSTKIKPLICGEAAFSAVSLALKRAQRSINMAFWGLDPAILLVRGTKLKYDKRNTLAEILFAKAAQGVKIKIIVWDGYNATIGSGASGGSGTSGIVGKNNSINLEYFYKASQLIDNIEMKMTNSFSDMSTFPSYHQKFIVTDVEEPARSTAFVMGHNMMPDYWDTTALKPSNSKRDFYLKLNIGISTEGSSPFKYQALPHNMSSFIDVSTQIWGGGITDVYHSFERIWNLNGGTANPTHDSLTQSDFLTQGQRGVSQLAATFTFDDYNETSIRQQYLNAISQTNKYVFILDQYCRDQGLTKDILKKLKARKDAGREIPPIIFISNDWENTPWAGSVHEGHDTEVLRKFKAAKIPIIYCKMVTKEASGRENIYIHAKVLVVDDVFYTIGSANYNERSMNYDPELNIGTVDPTGAEKLRRDLWNICIGEAVNEIMKDPIAGGKKWIDHLAVNDENYEDNQILTYGRTISWKPDAWRAIPASWFAQADTTEGIAIA